MNSPDSFNIFETLEKDDKELIHSSFICFLLQNYKETYLELLNLDYPELIVSEFNVQSEFRLSEKVGRLDVFASNSKINIAIETKFKSFPTTEQLEKYDKSLPPLTKRYLVVFDKTINYFKNPPQNWTIIDYRDIVKLCKKISTTNIEKDSVKIIFINHYIDFLTNKYLNKFNNLLQNKDVAQILSKGGTFWNLIFYELIKVKIQKELSNDYIVKTFSGRQRTPGLNILIENINFLPIKTTDSVWYELQNNLMKLKFGEKAYLDRDKLISLMIEKGFDKHNFAKKGSKKEPNSFTLYQEPIDAVNISIDNIAEQFIKFKNNIENKMGK